MHFSPIALVASLLVVAAVSAPLKGRQDAADPNGGIVGTVVDDLTSVDDPAVDLLINVDSGLEGFATVADGVLDQLGNTKKRDASGLPEISTNEATSGDNPVDDLLVNVAGGLAGGSTVLDGAISNL